APATVIAHFASTRDTTAPHGFAVTTETGVPLIEVSYEPASLRAHRRAFQYRILALALLPFPLGLTVPAASLLDRRPRLARGRARWTVTMRFAVTATALFAALA